MRNPQLVAVSSLLTRATPVKRLSLVPNKVEVSRVDKDSPRLAENEDGIVAVEGIGEQRQPPTNGEEPERDGDHALFSFLRSDPLDDEAHGKEDLPHKPDRQPELRVAHASGAAPPSGPGPSGTHPA